MAKSAGVGILPVVHDGNFEVQNGWKLRMPHTFRVQVLDPIPPEEVASKGVRRADGGGRTLMKEVHRGMNPDLYADGAIPQGGKPAGYKRKIEKEKIGSRQE